ncbi:MAG: glycosyltransferase family 4 protein [Phycisphaerae bacterium]
MKVALVIERAYPQLGGAETSVLELAAALRSADLDVDIVAAKGDPRAKHTRILCSNISGRRTSFSRFSNVLKDFFSQNHYDIIHSVLPFSFADVYQPRGGSYPEAIARNTASYPNRCTRFYKKLTACVNWRRNSLAKAERSLCEDFSGPIVAALSDYVAKQFKTAYNLPDERLIVIRNGVLTHKTADLMKKQRLCSQIMAKLGIKESDQPVFFLFVANNFRLKGLEMLIRAMQMTAARNPELSPFLIVVGSGNINPYRRLAQRLDTERRVIFMGHLGDIKNILGMSHAAVLPTFYDPCSRFILEALAADKPVITTKFNGASEMFVNNRHGRIIDIPENIPALAEAIGHFTDFQTINKAATAIVQDNIREQISVSRVAKELKILYQSIVERRSK